MTADTALALRSPADLVAAVPYLLGFHPVDSLTVVAVRDNRITFAARHDLLPPGTPDLDHHVEATHVAAVVARQGVDGATVIGHGSDERATPAVLRVAGALRDCGVPVFEQLRVTGDRYFSYQCQDPSCCPPEGVPFDVSGSAVAAAATYAGQVALPDRQSLAARLTPVTGPARVAMTAATARARAAYPDLPPTPAGATTPRPAVAGRSTDIGPVVAGPVVAGAFGAADGPVDDVVARVAAVAGAGVADSILDVPGAGDSSAAVAGPGADVVRQARRRAVLRDGRAAVRAAVRRHRDGGHLTDDEVARLGVLLTCLPVRDHAWERIDSADWQVRLWTDVLRRVEPPYVPAPACLLAFAAWRAGEGALACVAVDLALRHDPGYSMAALLDDVLRYALPPSAVDDWPVPDDRPHPPRPGRRRTTTD